MVFTREMELPGESLLRTTALYFGLLAELIAVIIVAGAVLTVTWAIVRSALFRPGEHPWSHERLVLGRNLILALEFLLAADVVRTAVAPTWDDIARLAAIAAIRTGLSFFLHLDIRETGRTVADQRGRD